MLDEIRPHIAELRSRLFKIVISYGVAFIVVFMNWQLVYAWMKKPLESAFDKAMIFTSLAEPFITALKISLYAGFVLALPFIMWQVWKFIAPALYENEKKMAVPFVFWGSLMFIAGAAFAYYVVFPVGFKMLITFGGSEFTAMPRMSEYVSFFGKLMLGFGIAFELPVITFFLATIGMVTDKTLTDFFRYAIVLIFILSALLTPPDVLTQFLMSGPLILLYGLSILIAKAINPHKEDEEDESEED